MEEAHAYIIFNAPDPARYIFLSKNKMDEVEQTKLLNEYFTRKTYIPSAIPQDIIIFDDTGSGEERLKRMGKPGGWDDEPPPPKSAIKPELGFRPKRGKT
jgi:hypothetical protein